MRQALQSLDAGSGAYTPNFHFWTAVDSQLAIFDVGLLPTVAGAGGIADALAAKVVFHLWALNKDLATPEEPTPFFVAPMQTFTGVGTARYLGPGGFLGLD